LTCSTMFLVPNIDQICKEMKKIKTGNRSLINLFKLNTYQKASISQRSSVYSWSWKQTRKRRRISGFCRSSFFFGIKNVRVGQSIGNTHIFLFGQMQMICAWHKIWTLSGRLSLMRNVQLMKIKIYIFRVYHIRIIAKKKLAHMTWNRQIPQ
jgi:hypothetical protein